MILVLNPENAMQEEFKKYTVREAVRAIVTDNKGKIAMLHVKNKNYYKIPGGGIKDGENKIDALKRECLEEIGSEIKVVGEIGKIIEYRKIFRLKQISYCLLARLKGKKGKPVFTDEEIEDGFEQIWLSYDEAYRVLSKNLAFSFEGKVYIVPRDITFLKEVKKNNFLGK